MDEFRTHLRDNGIDVGDTYEALWQWSVDQPAEFWRSLWQFYDLDVIAEKPLAEGADAVLANSEMPGARWFPDIRLNYVDQILRHSGLPGAAIVGIDETGARSEISWAELGSAVAGLAATLRDLGVGEGDVVAAYLPHIPEAVVAFLATASLGAIWSGCGQDYAPVGAAGRLGQLEPKVLFTADGYRYNGKDIDKAADSAELASLLPELRARIVVGGGGDDADVLDYRDAVAAGDPTTLQPVKVAFDHPLWVLFSSGTTGRPKGIVHGHGGVVVEHLKAAGLHGGLGADDVFLWQTALSWMMWNFQIAGLLVGSKIVCYSGSPLYPDADRLWQIVADEKVTYFGTSPGQLQASRKAGLVPGRDHDLSALRALGSTGSSLAGDLFTWVDENVKAGLPISSISGGTDVVTAFAGGSVGEPVVAGELSVRYLGVALESWAPDATTRVGEVGEMVVTAPMPSMPVGFWRDDDGSRYRSAYFEHVWEGSGPDGPVWRHGDWVTLTDRGSLVIHGRSDATLNRQGIRMGSADIYEVVEGLDEIAEAFVLGVDGEGGTYWMPLFVTLVPGATLDDALRGRIAAEIRRRLSPRHVPDEVIEAPGIPHTRTGKKLEVPVTAILAGHDEVNVDPKAVDDYSLIDWYAERGREHSW
ncbi:MULTISPECIES: acetoacetate--CoA ligase [unclassified Gordonia (in: high G+C Gram-positive bacteria)]|uniref:acetoacetate--CoA ligase n=1 Tax=unclassified Gordonia (in: high G+C Gram-positive bacteria) TaxID=2657482 RepID=UPI001F0DA42D|nr:acetoacetate--CoA ligase [Gordonia sp. ABSL49_1]MCH5641856.1 acetoacetate--CoA ligase [Gordonia sp. ABSL49_1]